MSIVSELTRNVVVVAFIIMLVAVRVIVTMIRRITGPITGMARAAKQMALGDLRVHIVSSIEIWYDNRKTCRLYKE